MSSPRGGYLVFSREALMFFAGAALASLPLNLGLFVLSFEWLPPFLRAPCARLPELDGIAGLGFCSCFAMGMAMMHAAIRRYHSRSDESFDGSEVVASQRGRLLYVAQPSPVVRNFE